MCVNNLSKVALDSAAAGIEPATSSRSHCSSIDYLGNYKDCWLIYWLIDWLIDWQIDQVTIRSSVKNNSALQIIITHSHGSARVF